MRMLKLMATRMLKTWPTTTALPRTRVGVFGHRSVRDPTPRSSGAPATRALPHCGRPPHPQGLTLIELLVTLAVLGILILAGIPSMAEMVTRHRLKTAAQALVDDLQWSRSEAIRRNHEVYLTIDQGAWCYSITTVKECTCGANDRTNTSTCTQPSTAPPLLKVVSGSDFPGVRIKDHTFNRSAPVAAFEPRRALALQPGSLTLASDHGDELRVILSLLGRVRVCSPDGRLWGYPRC